ncbi:MAG: TIGR00341 family protein [Bacteroidales bacterium]|nr:TIGR00341 family protein [Bacteroidales bacterium]MDY0216970.1 TIGR00341 family protein [Bacteroidales bacterium]
MKQVLLIRKIIEYFSLENEKDDYDRIHETISKDIIFKGTNLWILIFAIIVASVGLNMNSTAVIIGAMLISPLMGPINGMGYSIATYNFPLFRKSLKNFAFAVGTSLVASMTYFALSPISTAHSELLARTSPTIYDVLIALFGGLAGIVAITSKQKGNVIPGVAIATALMPPLCTAGYGLATGQFYFFFGAFYLFTINTVFIAISSVAISQILKFPIRTIVDEKQKKKINRWISFVIALIFIPSVYFGYKLVKDEQFNENVTMFISNVSIVEGNYLLKHEVDVKKRQVRLVYGGTSMDEQQKEMILSKASDFNLEKSSIQFQQGLAFDNIFGHNFSEMDNLKSELRKFQSIVIERDQKIDSIQKSRMLGEQTFSEIKALYPEISSCIYSDTYLFHDTLKKPKDVKVFLFALKSEISNDNKAKIKKWLQSRHKSDYIKVIYE